MKKYYQIDLQGLNFRQDADKIPANSSFRQKNVSLSKPGTWSNAAGIELLMGNIPNTTINGGISYVGTDGVQTLRVIENGNIKTYDFATGLYTTTASSAFTGERVQSVNYLGRVYHVSEDDYLCYETGGSTTKVVDSGNNGIKAKGLVVVKGTLYIIAPTYVEGTGAVTWGNRVYFSEFDNTNNIPSHSFGTGSWTWGSSLNFISAQTPIRAGIEYGDLLFIFTESTAYRFDISGYDTQTSIEEVIYKGCLNKRSLTKVNDWLIFMDDSHRIWAYAGSGRPTPISYVIEDDENEESIISQIDAANDEDICAGSLDNQFYFSVGGATVRGLSYVNAIIKGLVSPDFNAYIYTIDDVDDKPAIFMNTFAEGEFKLLYGAKSSGDVYQMNSGVMTNSLAATKFLDFDKPFSHKEFKALYIKYKPQPESSAKLTISIALDGNLAYSDVGMISTYSPTSTILTQEAKLDLPMSARGRSISIQFSNSQENIDWEVSGFLITYNESNESDARGV